MVENLEDLLAAGYKVEKSTVKDMFPNTPHAETVVANVLSKILQYPTAWDRVRTRISSKIIYRSHTQQCVWLFFCLPK